MKYQKTVAEYMKVLGVSRSTVRNYKLRGYPLDDPEAMKQIILTQRTGPANLIDPEGRFAVARLLKLELEVQRLRQRNDDERVQYVRRDEVASKLCALVAETSTILRQEIEVNLPPICEGKTAGEIQSLMIAGLDRALTQIHTGG